MAVLAKSSSTGTRTVVTLGASAQRRLRKLAAQERVSSGEIISRSLAAYEPHDARLLREQEESLMHAMLQQVSAAFRDVNSSLLDTSKELDRLHVQLAARQTE